MGLYDKISVILRVRGREIVLDAIGSYRIHRGEKKTVVMERPNQDEPELIDRDHLSVSKSGHLEIYVQKGFVVLRDENSSRGSYLNHERFSTKTLMGEGTYDLGLGDFDMKLKIEKK